jgi:hypothetical protein
VSDLDVWQRPARVVEQVATERLRLAQAA